MSGSEAKARFRALVNVSRETMERLETYETQLIKWNKAINLVSKSTISDIWHRHFLDSAQIWKKRTIGAKKWLDIGSGGGFPGLVVAVIALEKAPDLRVFLVESDARKAAFLRNCSLEMGVACEVVTSRIENLPPQDADIVSARALATLDQLLKFAERHLKKDGTCLFSKGRNYEFELTEARKSWTFNEKTTPSITDPGAVLLEIGGIKRV